MGDSVICNGVTYDYRCLRRRCCRGDAVRRERRRGPVRGRVLDVEFGDFGFVALRLDVELFP